MIDFQTYEEVKLVDVADFERAKAGYIYPRGSSTIQISASKGQISFLYDNQEVHSKEVVIIPQAGINQRYFNIVLHKNIERFMSKYATGINIQEHEIGNFPIQLHNQDTQAAIAKMLDYVDDKMTDVQQEMNIMKELKQTMLRNMMI